MPRRPGRPPRPRSSSRPRSSTTRIPNLAAFRSPKDAGLPGLGGAKIELIFIDHQGNPSVAQQQTLRLITQDKVHVLFGAYQSSVHASPRRRSPSATAFRSWSATRRRSTSPGAASNGCSASRRSRPTIANDLHALPRRHEEGRQEDRLDRDRQREHRLRHLGRRRRSRPPPRRRASRSRSAFPTAPARPTCRRRCCSSRRRSPTS